MRWTVLPYFVAAAILTAQSPILAQPVDGDPASGRRIRYKAVQFMPSRSPDDPQIPRQSACRFLQGGLRCW